MPIFLLIGRFDRRGDVDVILFPWRVFFYTDDSGQNVVKRWLYENEASEADYAALQALIDICKMNGPRGLASCAIDLGNDFYALYCQRKGGIQASPVFCYGPSSPTEITFLVGAKMVGKQIIPKYAAGIAEENLEKLSNDPTRKRLENLY